MRNVTVSDLIFELQQCDPDAPVRLATQPSWPFEQAVGDVVEVDLSDVGDDEPAVEPGEGVVVYIGEGGQIRYLPGVVADALGW